MHIINNIFSEFENKGIRYCHFKSNQHLDESFDGKSDFDVLVDSKNSSLCEQTLLDMNCKRFEPEYIGQYAGVENWLAFDAESGKIFHLHLHYQLVSGKALVKEYVLPWKDLFLSHTIKSPEYHIMTLEPNYELILLMARNVIKTKWRKIFSAYFLGYSLPKDIQKEYDYLKKTVNPEKLYQAANDMLGDKNDKMIAELILEKDHLNRKDFFQLSQIIKQHLKYDRRYNGHQAQVYAFLRRCADIKNKFLSRKAHALCITKKVSKSGGKIIAFVGIDGSGKSTVVRLIHAWLNYKIEAKRFYMGTGDGQVPLFAKIVKGIAGFLQKNATLRSKAIKIEQSERINFWKQPLKYVKTYVHALMIFSIVKSNHKKIEKMSRYRMNGGYSVLDRFPQLWLDDCNDGLKLRKYAYRLESKLIARLAEREENMMQIVKRVQPDLLFRLVISPETSMQRKPGDHADYDVIRKKAEHFRQIQYYAGEIIDIDAEKPLDEVLLTIQREIWSRA